MTVLNWAAPLELLGRSAHVVPLLHDHAGALAEAARDGELWKLWYTTVPSPDGMAAEIDRRLDLQARGTMNPFTIIDAGSGEPVGMTTYMDIDQSNKRLEIGSTWLRQSAQRGGLNTEVKLLLLTHAFETLACNAVELRTHVMNLQSRRAIERLGAKLDGILRHHRIIANGTLRDTCVYSIIAPEWPAVRANLRWRLEAG